MQGLGGQPSSICWEEGRVIDERSFVLRFQQGDHSVFPWLIQEYGTYVYRVAYSVLHDAKEAEDAAQETFLQIFKSLPEYRAQGLKTWLTRITVNKSIDIKRKRDRRKEEHWDPADLDLHATDSDEGNLFGLLHAERTVEVRRRIAALPAGHRQIVTKFYLEGKSHDQIAAELGVAVKTIESKLYRARAYIREHWSREEWG
ncbi:RNA polymerase sigma factor, sigma-70 family [Paenibacillus barengoltzii J12]|uniref:RNA polymerase sigma factor, sigma-70 family n=1 Tax=Paenibacillus barengoltzii J12 TaxID=935846 RepID=A0ABY1LZQ7_9BACL|nr:RNA polymerase sigma factor, sigma-70 family [Paenibacillus barengoltzii J12]